MQTNGSSRLGIMPRRDDGMYFDMVKEFCATSPVFWYDIFSAQICLCVDDVVFLTDVCKYFFI